MHRTILSGGGLLAVLMASLLFSAPAFAKKYDHGGGKQKSTQELAGVCYTHGAHASGSEGRSQEDCWVD